MDPTWYSFWIIARRHSQEFKTQIRDRRYCVSKTANLFESWRKAMLYFGSTTEKDTLRCLLLWWIATPCSNFFRVLWLMNSVTAQHPFQNTLGACSSTSADPLRPRLATVFILGFLARLPFWFGMSVAVSGGFLLREKLTEFKLLYYRPCVVTRLPSFASDIPLG